MGGEGALKYIRQKREIVVCICWDLRVKARSFEDRCNRGILTGGGAETDREEMITERMSGQRAGG